MKTRKEYSWASGARIAIDAAKAGPVLERLAANGCSAEDVLEEAKRRGSPLHGAFEWDVGKAARQQWLATARHCCSGRSE